MRSFLTSASCEFFESLFAHTFSRVRFRCSNMRLHAIECNIVFRRAVAAGDFDPRKNMDVRRDMSETYMSRQHWRKLETYASQFSGLADEPAGVVLQRSNSYFSDLHITLPLQLKISCLIVWSLPSPCISNNVYFNLFKGLLTLIIPV